jgi:hypothetical protein
MVGTGTYDLTVRVANDAGTADSIPFTWEITGPQYGTDFAMRVRIPPGGARFAIPALATGAAVGTVDWGDGSSTTDYTTMSDSTVFILFNVALTTQGHLYAEGDWVIRISGALNNIYNNSSAHLLPLIEVYQFGNVGLSLGEDAFAGSSNVERITAGPTDATSTNILTRTFLSCELMTDCDLSGLDLTGLQATPACWQGCTLLVNLTLSACPGPINILSMIRFCSSLTNLVGLDTWHMGTVQVTTDWNDGANATIMSPAEYEKLLIAWETTQPFFAAEAWNFGSCKYTSQAAADAKTAMASASPAWTFTDGGIV